MEILRNRSWFFPVFTILFGLFVFLGALKARGQVYKKGQRIRPVRDFSTKPAALVSQGGRLTIPTDPAVTIGRLPNGLTYYIRHTKEPAKRAELRLVVHVGSLAENEDQRGIAHFAQHMAFLGTPHFTENELKEFLTRSGGHFGADISTTSGFEESVYSLSIPTDSGAHTPLMDSTLKKGFSILADWAQPIPVTLAMVELEKPVVLSELKAGKSANIRLRDRYFPILFKGSRYADRLPIGKKEVLESMGPASFARFYADWYRPNLEAIIAVGDLDVHQTEAMIKTMFSTLVNPSPMKGLVQYPIAATPGTRVAILTDKEQPYTIAQWIIREDKAGYRSFDNLDEEVSWRCFNKMMKNRLDGWPPVPSAPYLFASSSRSAYLPPIDAYQTFVVVKGGADLLPAIRRVAEAVNMVKQAGFTVTEFEKAKQEITDELVKQNANISQTSSTVFALRCQAHYLEQDAMASDRFTLDYIGGHLKNVSLANVNQYLKQWEAPQSRYLVITAPEKEAIHLPSASQFTMAVQRPVSSPGSHSKSGRKR